MKITDGLAKLLTLKSVASCLLDGHLAETKAERTNTYPTSGQFANRHPETVVELAHQGAAGDTAILEQHFVGRRGVLSHLLFGTPNHASRGSGFNQKAADSLALGYIRIRDCPDNKNPGVGCAGYKNFTAVKNPVITVPHSNSRHRRRVGTGTGLSQCESSGQELATTDPGDITQSLLFAADRLNHLTDHVADRNSDRCRGTCTRNFSQGNAESDHTGLRAAVISFDIQPHETELCQLFKVIEK